jgi:hypothetical protein
MRSIPLTRAAVLAIAAGLSAILLAPIAGQAETPTFAPAPVDASAVRHVMGSGGLGSSMEETILSLAPAAPSWDQTSGYGTVEAIRALRALPSAGGITTQVPSDVRWAPVAAASWDATSGYGVVEAVRAARAISIAPASAEYLAAALARGDRAESAHLATIALPASQAPAPYIPANSDDRIAAAFVGTD